MGLVLENIRHTFGLSAAAAGFFNFILLVMFALLAPVAALVGNEGFACGYCELLVHVPLMLWTAVPLIWLMMIIARAQPRRREVRVYRPRAPPFRCTKQREQVRFLTE